MPATPPENPYDVADRVVEENPETVNPEEDLQPMLNELDRLIAGGQPTDLGPGGAPPPEGVPPEGAPAGEATGPAVEMQPLMDELGIDEARAQSLYDAAQQIEQTRGVPPADLAQMLSDDMQLRMRLESMAAGEADRMAADAMEETGFDIPPDEPAPGNEEETA